MVVVVVVVVVVVCVCVCVCVSVYVCAEGNHTKVPVSSFQVSKFTLHSGLLKWCKISRVDLALRTKGTECYDNPDLISSSLAK